MWKYNFLIVLFVILIGGAFLFNSGTKTNLKRILSNIILIIGVIVIFVFFIISSSEKTNDYELYADGFTIEKYDVVLDVGENNIIDVTENITVNFTSDYKHGIYKFTPSWLEYTGLDGNTIKRMAKLSNYHALNDPYSLDTVKGKSRIKIGDPNEYVGSGEKTYTIKYVYNMGHDPYKNFDELIFHAFGDYWGTEIKNASIRVNMPKKIDGYRINFFKDKYREENVNNVVDYTINNNTIYATFNAKRDYQLQLEEYCNSSYTQLKEDGTCDEEWYTYLPLEKSLTIDIELPDGYFQNTQSSYGYKSITMCILIILFAMASIGMYFKYGKKHEYAEPVELYPPNNLDAATIGYIYKKDYGKKLTIATIVQLASKGYIKIEEKNKNIIVTNMVKKTSLYEAINRKIIVKKLADATDNSLSNKLKKLFGDKDTTTINDDFDNFFSKNGDLFADKLIEIKSDTINDYTKEQLDNLQKELDEKYNKKVKMSDNEQIVYDALFKKGDENLLSEDTEFYTTFSTINDNLKILDNEMNDEISFNTSIISSVLFLISSIIIGLSYAYIKDMDPNLYYMYYIAFGFMIVTFIFTIIMRRKNEKGEELYSRINGFKNYIETAEKSQLEQITNENASYFYDILPYAYVLGVSKKWIQKFENIKIPNSDYMHDFSLDNFSYIDNISDSVITPSSSSSGCSSCGGGCSSCGGGCSSCGGGGSW